MPRPWPQPPHYSFPNVGAFRHVAQAYGDDNPLYCSPLTPKTVWGGIIAPPPMVGGDTLIGEDEAAQVPEDKRPHEGRPAAKCRVLLGQCARVVGAVA